VLVGLGLYLPYVAIHTTVFERFLAMTRVRGNVGFLMYVADSAGYFGYLASLGLMAILNRYFKQLDALQFFITACWLTSGLSVASLAWCWRYFAVRSSASPSITAAELAPEPATEGAAT